MNLPDDLGTGQHEQVVASIELPLPVAEALAAVGLLVEAVALHHGAEAAVEQQNAPFEACVKVV